jgi:CRP-like cAMP-binding protein
MRDSKPVQNETHLSRLPLFEALAARELERLARASRTQVLAKGNTLFSAGEPCAGLSVVMYGQVKVALSSTQGIEKVVDILQSGQSIGATELLLDVPYRVHAQALGDTLVLQVAKPAILDLLNRNACFAHQLLNDMSRCLHGLMVDLEGYTLHSGQSRVLSFLLREAEAQQACGDAAVVRLSAPKGVIASRLNLSPEHFSRILREMSELGLFAIRGRNIHIDDISRLQRGLA